ncbi:MAG: type VI secretion system contractile sheath domain-containing protein, partial [Planctomycetota bacterium]
MTKPISFGKIDVNMVSSMEETSGRPDPETPFRIAILGDFSGRVNRGVCEAALADRTPHFVDRDNLDNVLKKCGVEIKLPILGKESPPICIKFSELDDFHPDSMFERLDVFEALRETRKGLMDPSTFTALAEKMKQTETSQDNVSTEKLETSEENVPEQMPGGLLDQVLEETQENVEDNSGSPQDDKEWNNFIRDIVKPHFVPDIEQQQSEMVSAVDAATGELMRMVLHHPDFQALEAAWRGVYFLTSRLETDSQLKVYLIDISKTELANDLKTGEDLPSTGIYRLLVESTVETFGGEPWTVLAGNYAFRQTSGDAELLGRMAKIARASGAPFITAAHDEVLGCKSLAETPKSEDWKASVDEEDNEAWELLRRLPEASYIGLVLPRFLMRIPYGTETDPIEVFEFEEIPEKPDHNHYLWGNSSFVCVYLLGQAFVRNGWDFQPGIVNDLGGLPLHVYKVEGESRTKPCAEVVFNERTVEAILEKGIMPVLSYKDQDTIR